MSTAGRLARRILGVTALLLVLGWLVTAFGVVLLGRWDRARPADAIVVLGAAQYAGRPSPVLKARLDHGIALYRQGIAPHLLLTGGRGEGDTTSEAAVGRRYAMRQGVPREAILTEEQGRTTAESLRAVTTLAAAHDLDRLVLVSDPFHMLRVQLLATRLGLDATTSPTTTSPIEANRERRWSYVLRESVKVPATIIFGREATMPPVPVAIQKWLRPGA